MMAFNDGFAGTARFDRLPPGDKATIMQNALAMKALALSTDVFPNISKSKVRRLTMPILIVTGANTIAIHRMVNEGLIRLLPRAQTVTIPDAGHGSPWENPEAFNVAVRRFLEAQRP
jgi:pimeloyl-ACP methyl ester carboxylesterase